MFDSKKPFVEFCCMGHETYYTEDFESDQDDLVMTFDIISNHKVSFMPEVYEDVQKELLQTRFHEEISVQCDAPSSQSLSQLSSMPAYSKSSVDRILTPNPASYTLAHTARAFFPVIKEKFYCKVCKLSFKNGQALGGHMSRKH
jgi:C2H2-type zinc finger